MPPDKRKLINAKRCEKVLRPAPPPANAEGWEPLCVAIVAATARKLQPL